MPTALPDATTVALAHVVTAALYLGFQVTVRFVVYPQMAGVGPEAFRAYEAAHQRLVSRVVGPLFLGLATTSALLVASADVPRAASLACGAVFAGVLAVTALGAVPQHRTLSRGFDAAAHRRLLAWDGARVVLSGVQLALAVGIAVEGIALDAVPHAAAAVVP